MRNFLSSTLLRIPVSHSELHLAIDADNLLTGKFVNGILKNRAATLNKHILGAENYYTPEQIRSGLEAATGKKTHYAQVSGEQYKGFLPAFIAEEMLENHQFIDEPGYYNGAELEESHGIVEDKLVTWEEFVKKSGAF
jgi:hypothetical protein